MFNVRRATAQDLNEIINLNNELCKYEMDSGFDVYIKDFSLSEESKNYFLDLIQKAFVIVAEKDE